MGSAKGQAGAIPFLPRAGGRSGQAGASPLRSRGGGRSGQAVPFDFLAGMFIFMLMLSYFLILWDIFSVRYSELSAKQDREMAALSVSRQLVTSPGVPEDWAISPLSAGSIGLASRPGVLDAYRISALSSMPYANARQSLGVQGGFYVKIEDLDGARFATIGAEPANASSLVEVRRIAMLNGTIVNLKVQVYGN